MPVRKKGNKKNKPLHERDDSIVPKEGDPRRKVIPQKSGYQEKPRITAISTAGKKKRPK